MAGSTIPRSRYSVPRLTNCTGSLVSIGGGVPMSIDGGLVVAAAVPGTVAPPGGGARVSLGGTAGMVTVLLDTTTVRLGRKVRVIQNAAIAATAQIAIRKARPPLPPGGRWGSDRPWPGRPPGRRDRLAAFMLEVFTPGDGVQSARTQRPTRRRSAHGHSPARPAEDLSSDLHQAITVRVAIVAARPRPASA